MTMPHLRFVRGGLLAAPAVSLLLAACGGSSGGSPVSAGGSPAAAESAAAGAEGGGGGGEAPATRFVSSRNHYRVDAPGTMTEGSDGTAKSSHGLESLQIVVSGSGAGDPAGYARSDLASLRSASGFGLRSGPESFSLNASRSSQKTVYTVSGAANPVTGKAQTFVTVRYYVARNSSTMAVLTYSVIADQYDPQGADDVANTFAWQ
jgi:hypothetical protein